MNDAGNFLIETCDETISRDLKQQLLLLNGRWRELFMQVKQVCILMITILKLSLQHCYVAGPNEMKAAWTTFQEALGHI